MLLVSAKHGSVDDAAVRAAGLRVTRELARQPSVGQVVSYWSLDDAAPLESKDGRQALVLGVIAGSDDHVNDVAKVLSPKFTRDDAVVRVAVGGRAEVFRQVGDTIKQDLSRAESIAFPITLVLLVLVFGSIVAAGLPLLVGVVAIGGSFLALLRHLGDHRRVRLFVEPHHRDGARARHRLQLVRRLAVPGGAAERAVDGRRGGPDRGDGRTNGRRQRAHRRRVTPRAAGCSPCRSSARSRTREWRCPLLAALGAVLVLPALLAVLGHRVDSLRLFRHREPKPVGEGIWHRVAMLVMRRPIPIATVVILFLLVLGIPFLRLQIGLPDDRVLSPSHSSRQVQDQIRSNFTSNEAGALQVIAPGLADPAARSAAITAYAESLSRLRGVARVDALTGSYVKGTAVPAPPATTTRFEGPRAPGSAWCRRSSRCRPRASS